MNQTQRRLSIINYAISITDVETIQLQVLKLAPLKADEKVQEIITAINAENYARAQRLITSYLETPTEDILQRTSLKKQPFISDEEQKIIDEFDLFITSDSKEEPKEIDINDFLVDPLPAETKKEQSVDYEALLSIDVDNVLQDTITLETADTSVESFHTTSTTSKEKVKQSIDTDHIPKDTFFDKEEAERTETITELTPIEESAAFTEEEVLRQTDPVEGLTPLFNQGEKDRSNYQAIPYIAQKLSNMHKEYPPVEESDEAFDSVEALLTKISQEGYTEEEVMEALDRAKALTEESNYAEAAELLLTCAATESLFAQFMLARELYKGVLFNQNISEAFNRMYSLAMENYPEALCDLAQFYEHGVGTDKDKKKAAQFYKEAMEFGIKRAEKHYTRLTKKGRGLFGSRK